MIVAVTVGHANKIVKLLEVKFNEQAYIATYRADDPQRIINEFKHNSEKWIVAVGMISEGTDIPRLRVCCHLTRVKTELHFRQVLGRILRSNGEAKSDAFLYMPAEPDLIIERPFNKIPHYPSTTYLNQGRSSLADSYEASVNIFGKFKQELIAMRLGFSLR